jgi:hypothetical protein
VSDHRIKPGFGFWQGKIFCSYPMLRLAAGAFILAGRWILGATFLLRDTLERRDNISLCVCSVCVCMRTVSRVMGCCQISTRRVLTPVS